MQEWPYAKEPFDTKLFLLSFWKRIWLVLCAMLIGTVLIGGGYYLKKVVFGGPTEYDITSSYYVEYNTYDPVTGEMFNYTNATTWGSWVVSDWFVDRAWEHALEAGMKPEEYGVEKSDLKNFFSADLPSDVRIPTATVTTSSKELTEFLNDALQQAFVDFGVEQKEMDAIRIIDETPLAVADKDVRVLRACILGAVVGAFVAGFGLAFAIILDDSITIPETFTYRYGLPMAGFVGKGDKELSQSVVDNLNYLFRNRQKAALLGIGKNMDMKQLLDFMPVEHFSEAVSAKELGVKAYEKLRQAGGILLFVEADAHNGKEIEYVLQELQLQECTVQGALLWNADSKLISAYRFGRKDRVSAK